MHSTGLTRLCRPLLSCVAACTLGAVGTAHTTLNAPNGGHNLLAGTTVTIEWVNLIAHELLNWDLDYSVSGPNGPWIPIATDLPPGLNEAGVIHQYSWTVPDNPSTNVYVRVQQDNVNQDYEDMNDTVLTLLGPPPVPAVPALGLVLLTGLLAGAGGWLVRRKARVA